MMLLNHSFSAQKYWTFKNELQESIIKIPEVKQPELNIYQQSEFSLPLYLKWYLMFVYLLIKGDLYVFSKLWLSLFLSFLLFISIFHIFVPALRSHNIVMKCHGQIWETFHKVILLMYFDDSKQIQIFLRKPQSEILGTVIIAFMFQALNLDIFSRICFNSRFLS